MLSGHSPGKTAVGHKLTAIGPSQPQLFCDSVKHLNRAVNMVIIFGIIW